VPVTDPLDSDSPLIPNFGCSECGFGFDDDTFHVTWKFGALGLTVVLHEACARKVGIGLAAGSFEARLDERARRAWWRNA
jgi:hypothetical protein